MMAWNEQVDLYCERLAPGLWGEPANALSNLAFIIAAVALWRLQLEAGSALARRALSIRLLPLSVFLVGVFSALFHTLATRWAALLDTLFILIYCCVFLYAFVRHALPAPWWTALAVAAGFAAVSYAFPRWFPAGTANGSLAYLPNLAGLVVITSVLAARRAVGARGFALASAVFCVSLTLRTVDQAMCARFSLGTHFIWHLLNGLLLWIVSREMILGHWSPRPGSGREVEGTDQVADHGTHAR
jgi:hypothetical protein